MHGCTLTETHYVSLHCKSCAGTMADWVILPSNTHTQHGDYWTECRRRPVTPMSSLAVLWRTTGSWAAATSKHWRHGHTLLSWRQSRRSLRHFCWRWPTVFTDCPTSCTFIPCLLSYHPSRRHLDYTLTTNNKQCLSDPLPTWLLKANANILSPFPRHLFNSSLDHGSVPSSFKSGFVVWPTTSCFADWSKRRHVTLHIIDCQEVVLTCYRIFITCHRRPLDMSTHVTRSRVTCCKYSTKMKSRVRFPADH